MNRQGRILAQRSSVCYTPGVGGIRKEKLVFLLSAATLFALVACARGTYLRSEPMSGPVEIAGSFTFILYATDLYDRLKRAAFLDVEGDGYTLAVKAPAFEYEVQEGIEAVEATEKALHVLSSHRDFLRMRVARVLDGEGNTIAYELRPLYKPTDYGLSDVLIIDHWLVDEGRVDVVIDVKPSIRALFTTHQGL
jgi:hypothetical protein